MANSTEAPKRNPEFFEGSHVRYTQYCLGDWGLRESETTISVGNRYNLVHNSYVSAKPTQEERPIERPISSDERIRLRDLVLRFKVAAGKGDIQKYYNGGRTSDSWEYGIEIDSHKTNVVVTGPERPYGLPEEVEALMSFFNPLAMSLMSL